MLVLVFSFLFGLTRCSEAPGSVHWSYESLAENGPKNWHQLSPEFSQCSGSNQSPISLKASESQYDGNIGDLVFSPAYRNSLNDVSELELINNGHTFNLDIKYSSKVAISNLPTVSGGGLSGTYLLAGVHGHWSSYGSRGSEHTLGSKQYPLELHLVHYNTKYKSKTEALSRPDGLAVLAVLCQVAEDDDDESENQTVGGLLGLVSSIKETGQKVPVQIKIKPFQLLPQEKRSFFRYQGSLTTPPCSEVVTWTVFRNSAEVKRSELALLRRMKNGKESLADNYRPIQLLNGRKVLKTFSF